MVLTFTGKPPMPMTVMVEDGLVLQRVLVGEAHVEMQYTAKQARALASALVKSARFLDHPEAA